MKVLRSWFSDYVNIDYKDFENKMTMSGTKVEGTEELFKDITNVVVGEILEVRRHPNADKLVVCTIKTGDKTTVQIVTGAPNIKEGMKNVYVPVALNGATLSDGLVIKKNKIRGELSEGMLCSLDELGIKNVQPYDGIYIFDTPKKHGQDAKDALNIRDFIIEFEITSNRPDCLSVFGLSKEIAAVYDVPFKIMGGEIKDIDENIEVGISVENPELCERYMARQIKNVKIKPSPKWMQDRLEAGGIRPINNIVDITNYVLLEYGQPMHAFDLRDIKGGKIIVRRARDGEELITLDDKPHKLDNEMLVIADCKSAIGLAGVMGGLNSEIKEDTCDVIFESANFDMYNIRKTSTKLSISSEAATRFSKGINKERAEQALNRALQLVTALEAGEALREFIDIKNYKERVTEIKFEPDRINTLLGAEISKEEMINILGKLDFKLIDKGEGKGQFLKIPEYRIDIEGTADIAEEVIRIYGYDKIKPTIAKSVTSSFGVPPFRKFENRVKAVLNGAGLSEILTPSFMNPNVFERLYMNDEEIKTAVEIRNPLGEETRYMRITLLDSMLDVMKKNQNHKTPEGRFFEIGTVYLKNDSGLPKEPKIISIGAYGSIDFYGFKSYIDELLSVFKIDFEYEKSEHKNFHPGRTADVLANGKILGHIGEVHPDTLLKYEIGTRGYVALLDAKCVFDASNFDYKYKHIPKYPSTIRDIAVVISKEIPVGQIEKVIKKYGSKLLEEVTFFDIYTGKQIEEGKKSVAFNLKFTSNVETLKDEDVNKLFNKIVMGLDRELNAKLR